MISSLPRVIALVILVGMATPTHADPVMECSTGNGSQVETRECLNKVQKNADTAMDTILGFAMKAAHELDGVTGRKVAAPALEAGQAAWSKYRDKHCDFVGATFGGGSGTGIAILGCRIETRRARSNELMKFTQ